MADELKPPVAIRITRPYKTELEFLEREFDTLTRTSVMLLGAQPRPQGVVLRFEIVLQSGESILRGEGRVVGFKEKAHAGESGLTLRFTRLDARSKALVDKAAALRDARVKASTSLMAMPAVVVPPAHPVAPTPPRPPEPPLEARRPTPSTPPPVPVRRTPPPLPSAPRAPEPEIPPAPISSSILEDIETTHVDAPPLAPAPVRPAPPPLPPPPPVIAPTPSPTRAAPVAPRPASVRPPPLPPPVSARVALPRAEPPLVPPRGTVERPADRDLLLSRLRTRAGELPADRVAEILRKPATLQA